MKNFNGFSLIEMAIVMLIIGALIGSAILPISAQRDSNNIKKARVDLKTIEEALYGFAIRTGRLPCPAQPGSGNESVAAGVCSDASIGFVPSTLLGLSGTTNCDGLLTDPWGNPYRYSVTEDDSDASGFPDFTTAGEINAIGVALLTPDIRICTDSTCAQSLTATPPNPEAVAVVFSMGKNRNTVAGLDETQNAGEATIASTCATPLTAYGISNDRDYVSHLIIEGGANQFDDVMIWLSPNILYARMLAAGQL